MGSSFVKPFQDYVATPIKTHPFAQSFAWFLFDTIPGHLIIEAVDDVGQQYQQGLNYVTGIVIADWVRYEVEISVDVGNSKMLAMLAIIALNLIFTIFRNTMRAIVVSPAIGLDHMRLYSLREKAKISPAPNYG